MKKNRAVILLAVIYFTYLSLGLPDGALGAAWPPMRAELALDLESLGYLTTVLLVISAVSSTCSGWAFGRFGMGGTVWLSGLLTGTGLLGYAISPGFFWIFLATLPLGLGQGAVDSCVNLYVARHYSSRHMSWLHCFWSFGAGLGPFIMTFAVTRISWRRGFVEIAAIQLILAAVLFICERLRLWDDREQKPRQTESAVPPERGLESLASQAFAVLIFFLYSGIRQSMGQWSTSVLLEGRGIPIQISGLSAGFFFGSVMVGRFLTGLAVNRVGNLRMMRGGLAVAFFAAIWLRFSSGTANAVAGMILFGLGLAPFYPCLMHETTNRYTKRAVDKLVGYQVGSTFLGSSVIAACIGFAISYVSLELLFVIIAVMLVMIFALNEYLAYLRKRV